MSLGYANGSMSFQSGQFLTIDTPFPSFPQVSDTVFRLFSFPDSEGCLVSGRLLHYCGPLGDQCLATWQKAGSDDGPLSP